MTSNFDGWAVLELMGHGHRVGRVREVEMFGAKLLRIDIPAGESAVTEFYAPSAIYALCPVSEDFARHQNNRLGDPRNALAYLRLAQQEKGNICIVDRVGMRAPVRAVGVDDENPF